MHQFGHREEVVMRYYILIHLDVKTLLKETSEHTEVVAKLLF